MSRTPADLREEAAKIRARHATLTREEDTRCAFAIGDLRLWPDDGHEYRRRERDQLLYEASRLEMRAASLERGR